MGGVLQNDGSPLSKALNFLRNVQGTSGVISDFSTSCWAVMAIAAAGENPNNWRGSSGKSIVDYLVENRGMVDLKNPTSITRFVLAMTAARENPRNIGGTNYVEILKGFFNGTQIGSPSQLNDDFWGVMALVSAGEDANSMVIRGSVNFIELHQNADGGWGWNVGGARNVDDTAAAVMFLNAFLSPWGFAGLNISFQMLGMAIIGFVGGAYKIEKTEGGFCK